MVILLLISSFGKILMGDTDFSIWTLDFFLEGTSSLIEIMVAFKSVFLFYFSSLFSDSIYCIEVKLESYLVSIDIILESWIRK